MSAPISANQSSAVQYVAAREPGPLLAVRALGYLQRWRRGEPDELRLNTNLLTINFHPDRPFGRSGKVIDCILRTGRIQSQFESTLTNGFALGSKADVRARRESILFGGAYDDVGPVERPKYGAVNLFSNPRGGWPRFGSSHWVLDPSILPRCTVTVPGSHSSCAWWGSHADLASLTVQLPVLGGLMQDRHRFRLIDGPVELQVHGDILLERDVTALVLDPSFRGTSVEMTAKRISEVFDVALHWAPSLKSTGADWKVPSTRQHARERVISAPRSGEVITAAWIGQELWMNRTGSLSRAILDGASRYLWNRLLLMQEIELLPRSPAHGR